MSWWRLCRRKFAAAIMAASRSTSSLAGVRPASPEVILGLTGAEVGFAGPVGLDCRVIADQAVTVMHDACTGANKTDYHITGVNPGRDFEIKESADTMWRLLEGPRIRVLWDLRDACFNLGTAEVRDLAEFVKLIAPSSAFRSAFVASRNLEFSLLRTFALFRETEAALTSVFRNKQQAVEWLTNDLA